MAHGDTEVGCRLGQDHGLENGRHDTEHREPDDRTYDVKGKVDNSGALGVLVGAEGREERGHAGTDVLSHDDGNGGSIGHRPRGGQSLQDTHRGRAGLDDTRHHGADDHTQNRIGEGEEEVLEFGNIGQTLDGVAHGIHTEHQGGKAQEDGTHVLLF